MEVIYSQAAKFAGAGIGSIAYQFVRQMHRAGVLKRAIVGYGERHDIPSERVVTFPWIRGVAWLARDYQPLRDAVFDRFAARRIQQSDVFHGWSHQCLQSIRKAKALGAVTIVERPNSHDRAQYRLLQEEFERWGFTGHQPVRPWGLTRGLAEYDLADFITVPSPFAHNSMLAEGISEHRLFVVPYGVDCDWFVPGEPPKEVFRLLFVGQVSLRKGVPYLLKAWEHLHLSQAELCLAGRVTPDAKEVVTRYTEDATIRFLGHVRDARAEYQRATAFILPSIEEGSALVTYEAMACGLPSILTPHTGAVARDGVECLQVPIRDAEALTAAIERLYQDADLRQEMGRAARSRAEDYTWDAAGERLLQVYSEALGGRRCS